MNLAFENMLPEFLEDIVQFAETELGQDFFRRDHDAEFSREDWDKCAAKGVLRSRLPREYGGNDLTVVETVRLFESLGYGCQDNGLLIALSAQLWTVQVPVLQFGSTNQRKKYLPKLASGEWLACDGITEIDAGSDSGEIQTRAQPVPGGYLLNGRKTYITMAGHADVALIVARTDPEGGQWGLTAFLVDADARGFRQEPCHEKMGLRTLPMGELYFDDCFVPEEARLGSEGSGVGLFNYSMDWERSFIQASHVGRMARLLDKCVAHARGRNQFGQAIGKFQAVAHRIADMRLKLETSRLHLYKMAHLKDEGKSAPLDAAMTNLVISEACVANAESAIRIHGAYGYLQGEGIEHELRDCIGGLIYAGTSDIQHNIIAGLLGL